MALTVRTNGSLSANIINSTWFNDIRDLFTGTMQDQEVTIKNLLILKAIGAAPASAATAALQAGAGMGIGLYTYVHTYINADGETTISPPVNITTTSGNQQVNLSAITVGPTGTTDRKIYRTAVGGGTVYKFVNQLGNNTLTTYFDAATDASLGVLAPVHPSFGGSLLLQDSGGVTKIQGYSDGALSLASSLLSNQPGTVVNGSVTGTITFFTPIWGTSLKIMIASMNNYNAAGVASFNFPSVFNNGFFMIGGVGSSVTFSLYKAGAVKTIFDITALGGAAAGTDSGQTTVHGNSFGHIPNGILPDQIQVGATSATAWNSSIIIIGV